jgi:hypothetical protein
MTTPFLIHTNLSKPFVLEMDASNFALGAILSQLGENNFLHLVGFHSCKFSPIEINYKIHDKKILAIVDAFEEWRHLLERAQHEITVYSDHKNVQIFHDDSCVESMSSSMGIILVSILVCDYLSSRATIRETRCIISSLVPCA